jgi:hypothetical protein
MRCSPYSRVATPSDNPTEGMEWSGQTSTGCNPCVRSFNGYDVDLRWTIFSRQVQLLHQRDMTMSMYPGPSCPDNPFSEELGDTEVNTQVRGVHAYRTVLNLGTGQVNLGEGFDSPWVSPLTPTFDCLSQFRFLNMYVLLCRVSGVFTVPIGGSPYLRMWRGGRPAMSTPSGCRHGGKGGGPGAPLRRWHERGGSSSGGSLRHGSFAVV